MPLNAAFLSKIAMGVVLSSDLELTAFYPETTRPLVRFTYLSYSHGQNRARLIYRVEDRVHRFMSKMIDQIRISDVILQYSWSWGTIFFMLILIWCIFPRHYRVDISSVCFDWLSFKANTETQFLLPPCRLLFQCLLMRRT